jgi:hypothetical protein
VTLSDIKVTLLHGFWTWFYQDKADGRKTVRHLNGVLQPKSCQTLGANGSYVTEEHSGNLDLQEGFLKASQREGNTALHGGN